VCHVSWSVLTCPTGTWRPGCAPDDQGGIENDFPGLDPPVVEAFDDGLDGLLGHQRGVLADGGEVDKGQPRDFAVVVADHRDIARNVEAAPDEGVQDAVGAPVVGREDGGRQLLLAEDAPAGGRAGFLGVVAGQDPDLVADGWSSATASELAARQTAMTLVAAWYRSLDGGHVVFCANDSAPNLDYLRDVEAASGILAAPLPDAATTRNPRQDVQHAHLHAFYAEHDPAENHESPACDGHPAIARGRQAFSLALAGDAVPVEPDSTSLAADLGAAAQPWGGSYCSYQLGADGPLWVMPALGPSQDEVNRRLARADGLQAGPDPKLDGAINLARPSLADPGRLHAAQQAAADQRAGFQTLVAQRGLNARSLPVNPDTVRPAP